MSELAQIPLPPHLRHPRYHSWHGLSRVNQRLLGEVVSGQKFQCELCLKKTRSQACQALEQLWRILSVLVIHRMIPVCTGNWRVPGSPFRPLLTRDDIHNNRLRGTLAKNKLGGKASKLTQGIFARKWYARNSLQAGALSLD
jgi:hypothetical protein